MSDIRTALEDALSKDEQEAPESSRADDGLPATNDDGIASATDGESASSVDLGASPSESNVDLNALAEKQEKPANAEEKPVAKEKKGVVPAFKGEPKKQLDANVQAAENQAPTVKPPQSWRPDEREGWDQIPEKAKEAIRRRENEMVEYMRQTADDRRFAQNVSKKMEPYRSLLQTIYPNPEAAIENLCQTLNVLHTAPIPQKVRAISEIINTTIGRDPNAFRMLDEILSGEGTGIDPQQALIEQQLQQRLAPIEQRFNQLQQLEQQQQFAAQQMATQTVEQFLSQQEFGNDVRETMADLMELAMRRGQELTLEQAYSQACNLDPTISQIIQRKQQEQLIAQRAQATQKAKSAAVSIAGSPTGGDMIQKENNDSIRAAIEASINQLAQ